jgi:hypothetical protein
VLARSTDGAGRPAAAALGRRLARDLHDSVSQTLIGLHLTAQAAVELWETQPARARAAVQTVRALAAGAATELRAVLLDLHDAVLEAHCALVRERSGLRVALHVVESGRRPCGDAGAGQAAARGARGGGLSPGAGGPDQRGQARRGQPRHGHAGLERALRVWVRLYRSTHRQDVM